MRPLLNCLHGLVSRHVSLPKLFLCLCAGSLSSFGNFTVRAASATLSVQADQPGIAISSNLFGIFFEEINSAGDGGLYAEMVRNRSFEDSTNATPYWTLLSTGSAVGQMALDTSVPLSPTNSQSLRLTFQSGPGTVGVANSGFWGMPLTQGGSYQLGFYARASAGGSSPLAVSLENSNSTIIYAQATVPGLGTNWQHYRLTLISSGTDASARLAFRLNSPGNAWLDFVSLFPQQTFKQRTNGLRPDLADMLANLNPSFVRFPGGSWIDGMTLANAYHWKPTIGLLENRQERTNLWGYMVSNGLGYHEYLQMCEDIGAQPLFVVNCGMDVNQNAVPTNQMPPWVQEALDAVQYANGDVTTFWGAQRAANGHPEPFNLQFMEIGNENGGSAYNDHYALFYDAIKAQYPQMHLIADSWGGIPSSRPVEIMDEHYYSSPAFFINNATRYDGYNRSGPKVYVGEYAVTSGSGNGNLAAALGEAAFMTGLERNADVVSMASYAPLFANLNNKDWNPDLIYFNGQQVYGTPSYYVQQMFSQNRGDYVLPITLDVSGLTNASPHGAVGLGSWNTQVQYTNVVVTSNGVTLYQSDFTSGAAGWKVYNGAWSTTTGLYQQTAITTDCRTTTGDTNWNNYTISLRARKTGGNEGFLILFNWQDDNNWTWWNIGGWNNTLDGVEQMVNGSKTLIGSQVAGSINTNQWYDIKIILTGWRIQCYLDGQLIQDVQYPGPPHGAVGLGTWNTQASFTNFVVTNATQQLYASDFPTGASGWRVFNGTWSVNNAVYQQTAITTDCRSTTGDTNWSDYTITLEARKDGGNEGFLILFNWLDDNNWTWWNIGGWNNTQHAIEQMVNGTKSIIGSAVPGSIQSGRWYDIRIVLSGTHIRCYLDGQLVHDVTYSGSPALLASAAYSSRFGQVIVKAVNVSSQPLAGQFALLTPRGLAPNGSLTLLTSASPTDENSLTQPTKVFPATTALTGVSTNFAFNFPANSLSVFRLQILPDFPVGITMGSQTQLPLASLANGVLVSLSSFITNTVSVQYTVDTVQGVLTRGTLQFQPGDITKPLQLAFADFPSNQVVRVTLSNPLNGQLTGPAQVYYIPTLNNPTDPPRLAWARFPDQSILYWSDTASTLLQAPTATGSWNAVSITNAPFPLDFSAPAQFYRLKR